MPGPVYSLDDALNNQIAIRIAYFDHENPAFTLTQHNLFTLLLCFEGGGSVVRDTSIYGFESLCLLSFAIYQPFIIEERIPFSGIMISFHPAFFCLFKHRYEVSCNGVLFNNLYDSPVLELETAQMQSLVRLADQIREELSRGQAPDEEILISHLKVFLITATRLKLERWSAGGGALPAKSPAGEELMAAIEANFKQMHRPSDYGSLLHISTRALNKISKSCFNKSLSELISERLIIEAKRTLYLTARSVKQVAYELGYEDEFYFSRFFKKQVGVSPQIFRDRVGFNKLNA